MRARQSSNQRPRVENRSLGRAIRYLAHYKGAALLPYLFLLVATISQLAVPKLLGNIIDTVTNSFISNEVLSRLSSIPAALQSQIFQAVGLTQEQMVNPTA